MPVKHTTMRLSDAARAAIKEMAADYSSETAVMEEAILDKQRQRVAYGQQVERAVTRLIASLGTDEEAGATLALAELLHSLPAATGIAAAVRRADD